MKKNDQGVKSFVEARNPSCFKRSSPTVSQMLKAVIDGRLFGAVECDLHVPDSWPEPVKKRNDYEERFEKMSPSEYVEMFPLFCTTDVPMSAVGSFVRDHIEKCNTSKKTCRLLVGGMKAKKILLVTPLLRWYINHGLEVTDLFCC